MLSLQLGVFHCGVLKKTDIDVLKKNHSSVGEYESDDRKKHFARYMFQGGTGVSFLMLFTSLCLLDFLLFCPISLSLRRRLDST